MTGHQGSNSQKHIAFIAGGRLFYVNLATGQRREILCEFGENMKERINRTWQNREWKYQSNQQTVLSTGYSLWSDSTVQNPTYGLRSMISGASFAPNEQVLFFSFDGEDVNGLFAVDVNDLKERRLFHLPNSFIRNPALSPGGRKIVYSQTDEDREEHLFLYDKELYNKMQLTEGDSIDTSPAWSPDEQTIVYQSAGIGRNTLGFDVSIGPFSIYQLDFRNSRVEQLCEIPGRDLHNPRFSADGKNLLFISKPTESHQSLSLFRSILQLLTVPFRFVYAIFEFLNQFVARYTGKPLLETSVFKRRSDMQQSLLLGYPGAPVDYDVLLDDMDDEREKIKAPKSWELVQYNLESGEFQPMIRGVSSFDLSPADGSILYSNGREILTAQADGKKSVRVYQSSFVKNVLWC